MIIFSKVFSIITAGSVISFALFNSSRGKCNSDIKEGLFCPGDHLMIFLKVNNDWIYPNKRNSLCQALSTLSGTNNYTCIFQKKNKPGLCPNSKGFGVNCINYFYHLRKGGKKCTKILATFQSFFAPHKKRFFLFKIILCKIYVFKLYLQKYLLLCLRLWNCINLIKTLK